MAEARHSALPSLSSSQDHQQNGKFYNRPVNYGPYTTSNRVRESNYFPRDIGYTYENIHQPGPRGPSKNSHVISSQPSPPPPQLGGSGGDNLHQNSLSFSSSHSGPSSAILMQTPMLNIASPHELLTNREAQSTQFVARPSHWSIVNPFRFLLVNTGDVDSLSRSDLGGAVFTPETENESFYNPRPSLSSPGILETSGSTRAGTSAGSPVSGWRPGFSPSDFIGSVNQPKPGTAGKQHTG